MSKRPFTVILDFHAGDLILQVRAAEFAMKTLKKPGEITGIIFGEDLRTATHYGVRLNKNSVRVYPR